MFMPELTTVHVRDSAHTVGTHKGSQDMSECSSPFCNDKLHVDTPTTLLPICPTFPAAPWSHDPPVAAPCAACPPHTCVAPCAAVVCVQECFTVNTAWQVKPSGPGQCTITITAKVCGRDGVCWGEPGGRRAPNTTLLRLC